MVIKSTVENTPEVISPEYPKLMRGEDTNIIVLFVGHGSGMVVGKTEGGKHPSLKSEGIGYISNDWTMYKFKEYYGSVTLVTKKA